MAEFDTPMVQTGSRVPFQALAAIADGMYMRKWLLTTFQFDLGWDSPYPWDKFHYPPVVWAGVRPWPGNVGVSYPKEIKTLREWLQLGIDAIVPFYHRSEDFIDLSTTEPAAWTPADIHQQVFGSDSWPSHGTYCRQIPALWDELRDVLLKLEYVPTNQYIRNFWSVDDVGTYTYRGADLHQGLPHPDWDDFRSQQFANMASYADGTNLLGQTGASREQYSPWPYNDYNLSCAVKAQTRMKLSYLDWDFYPDSYVPRFIAKELWLWLKFSPAWYAGWQVANTYITGSVTFDVYLNDIKARSESITLTVPDVGVAEYLLVKLDLFDNCSLNFDGTGNELQVRMIFPAYNADPGGSEWPAPDPDNYPAYDKWGRGIYLSAILYVRFGFTRYEQ